MTSLTAFGDLLKQSIGLDAGSIGVAAIERAVQTRTGIECSTARAYCTASVACRELRRDRSVVSL